VDRHRLGIGGFYHFLDLFNMNNKCHMPTYVISIISTLIATICGLVVWTYQKDIAAAKDSIKEIQSTDISQGKEITELKTDIRYIKESQDGMSKKIDEIYRMLK
jgi:tetrahydromethanopterin S-methyltransferase subunit C